MMFSLESIMIIKIAQFDRIDTTRNGWQDEVDEETVRLRGQRGYGTKNRHLTGNQGGL